MLSKFLSFWMQFREQRRMKKRGQSYQKRKKRSYQPEIEQFEVLSLPSVTASFAPLNLSVGEGDGSVTVTVTLEWRRDKQLFC